MKGVTLASLAVVCGCGSIESASFDVAADGRADWVRAEIAAHNAWLSEEVRGEKYAEMAESPLAFLRGSNHLYWADLAADPRLDTFGSKDTRTFLQGDLHVGNFGAFHDDEGNIVYDLNDFDEGVVGDYQLDLWRGAISIVLASGDFSASQRRSFVEAYARAYVEACEGFVGDDDEADAFVTSDTAKGPLIGFLEEVAEKKSRAKLLDKWTAVTNGARLLSPAHDDLAPIAAELRDALAGAFVDYGTTLSGGLGWSEAYFAIKDAALRLHAGVGSLGVARYYVLVEGPSTSLDDDVILDVKLTPSPTGLPYVDADHFDSLAERAVAAQKALLTNTDDHLGWLELDGHGYTVRERSPYKDDVSLEDLDTPATFLAMAEQWGAILAAAHARADKDADADLVPSSLEKAVLAQAKGRRTKLYSHVWKVASSYAAQVEKDHQAFVPMID